MKKTAYYFFIAALIFSPLAFGTVETWSYLIMECLVFASALLLIFSSRGKHFYRAPGLVPLLLVNAFILFQIIPLPAIFVKLLSPSAHEFYQNVALLTGESPWIPLTIYPRATLMELLRFATYGLFYVIAVQFFSDARVLKNTISWVVGFAAVLSLVAIIEFVTESLDYPLPHDKIFWLKEVRHPRANPMGPYVNRNHYAGFMEMIFPLALALFMAYRPIMTKISLKRKIADFFAHRRVNQHFLYGTAAILIATSILLSLSRGGILSLTLSMVLFSGIIIFKAKQNKAGFFIAFIVVIVLLLTGTSGWDAIFKRFENLRDQSGGLYHVRFIYWEDSIRIFRDFPLVGAGAGTFEKIYPLYKSFAWNNTLEHAHNDYLEFLSTGGIILPVLMGWCLFSILYSASQSFMKRREWYSMLLFTGCVTAIGAILLHSVVDFNMQIGANGLYFFLILALAVSSANTRLRPGIEATYLKPTRLSPFLPGITVLFLFLTATYTHGGALVANHISSGYRNTALWPDMPRSKLMAINQAAKASSAFDFLNPRYAHIAANTASLLSNNAEAMKDFERSLRLDPKNSRYLMDTASLLYRLGKTDTSEALFNASIRFDKANMAAYIKYAAMLLETTRKEKSFEIMKQAISIDPEMTDAFLALMVQHHIGDDQMHFALPDRVKPYLVLGGFFNSLGEKQKAEESYLTAIGYVSIEKHLEKSYFLHVYQFYVRNHRHEDALHIILKAIGYFPEDHGLHYIAGDLYKKLGIDYRAEEEFRKADILKQTLN